jgi:hypothetical protein
MTIDAPASPNGRAAAGVRRAYPDVVALVVLAVSTSPLVVAAAFAAAPLGGEQSSREGLRLSAVAICLAAALVVVGCCGMALLRHPFLWLAIGAAVAAAAVAAAVVLPDPSAPRSDALADVGVVEVVTEHLWLPWTWPPLLIAVYGLSAALDPGLRQRRRDAFPAVLMTGLFTVTLTGVLLLAVSSLVTGGAMVAGSRTFSSYGLLALLGGVAATALLRDRRWLFAGAACFGVLTLAALVAQLTWSGASPGGGTTPFRGWEWPYPAMPLWTVVVLGLLAACLDPRSVWSDVSRGARPAAPAAPARRAARWLDRADRATAWMEGPRRRRR